MSKKKPAYDAKKLFLQGLMAFGNFFSGVKVVERVHLTKKQQRVRKAFKAQGIARREQRRLAAC